MMKRSKREGSPRAQKMGIDECIEGERRELSYTKEERGMGASCFMAECMEIRE